MLQDELHEIYGLTGRPGVWSAEVPAAVTRITGAWKAAVFSGADQQALLRYFHYHQERISDLLNTVGEAPFAEILCSLLDHLLVYHSAFFYFPASVPKYWHRRLVAGITGDHTLVSTALAKADVSILLKDSLRAYLDEIMTAKDEARFSFATLLAFKRLLSALRKPEMPAEGELDQLLYYHNFNHLGFFDYRRRQMKAVLDAFTAPSRRLEKAREERLFYSMNRPQHTLCLPQWPGIGTMLAAWLEEEIILLEKAVLLPAPEKLRVNLPVAHMAFLLRLFHEESFFGDTPLTTLFRFMSRHYSTRRQQEVSAGSLSKEFYSTSQVTAGRVLALLKNMTARINHNFFPLLFAAGAAFGA